ncbi:MAG: hypothetical protein HZB91_06120 [Elusimicrobia bacterium]|nr:hypothetical protein [Elusimicrobiota bacterium]
MILPAKRSVSTLLAAVLFALSPGAPCWAVGASMAKAIVVKTGLPLLVPGAATASAGFLPRQEAFSGTASMLGLPSPLSPLPWSSGDNEALPLPAALPDLTVPMAAEPAHIQPAQAIADEISEASRDIAPMVEELGQGKALASEGSREAGEGIFQRLLGIRLHAAPAWPSLSPKIKVTPVSEHLPGVFFVKFLRGTTLEHMLGILSRNGVEPEVYADNGDGFRVRVAATDAQAGPAARRLASVGQVESVEVNRKVYGLLRGEDK